MDFMFSNHILLVEDDESLRLTQAMFLKGEGFLVTAVGSGAEALRLIAADQFHAVVTDLRLDEPDGLQILAKAKEVSPETEVILITGFGSVDTAVEAMKSGAYDYLTKPVDPEDLVLTLKKAVETATPPSGCLFAERGGAASRAWPHCRSESRDAADHDIDSSGGPKRRNRAHRRRERHRQGTDGQVYPPLRP